jgi:hypothetical protein
MPNSRMTKAGHYSYNELEIRFVWSGYSEFG